MTKANRIRRANIARSIACHKRGDVLASPLVSLRFVAWVRGQRKAARVGKKSHHDLDRGHERVPATKERQYRCAARTFCPPKLPAQQQRYRHQAGPGSRLETLRPKVAP